MTGLFLALLLTMQNPPLPDPRPPRLPPMRPPPLQTPLIRPEPLRIDPGRLVRVEPNVCAGKQDGFQCGTGAQVNVSYWCEAYTPMVRTVCARGCAAATGQCVP